MSTSTTREFILVADASPVICERVEVYLTEHEGDDLSISVRPWGTCGNETEGLYAVGADGERRPACLRHDCDDSLEERVEDLIRSAWEYAHALILDGDDDSNGDGDDDDSNGVELGGRYDDVLFVVYGALTLALGGSPGLTSASPGSPIRELARCWSRRHEEAARHLLAEVRWAGAVPVLPADSPVRPGASLQARLALSALTDPASAEGRLSLAALVFETLCLTVGTTPEWVATWALHGYAWASPRVRLLATSWRQQCAE